MAKIILNKDTWTKIDIEYGIIQFFNSTALSINDTPMSNDYLVYEAGDIFKINGTQVYCKNLNSNITSFIIAEEEKPSTAGEVTQHIKHAETGAELFAQWGNFAGVNTENGDFVTYVAGLNGQAITALSASPLITGESYVVNTNKAVQQPCAMEVACSFVRGGGIGFATASLFANDPVTGADTVPTPINIVSYYQSSADASAPNTGVAGTVLTLNLETPLPSVGSNQAVFIGDWVNITGLVDNRFNYPNACISFIDPTRKIICIKYSDEANLPSILSPASGVTTPTLGTAKVNFYNNFSGAKNAFGIKFTGSVATSAAVVSIFGGDDNQVSGTLNGDHRVTLANSNPNYISGGTMGQYEIKANSRYKLVCTPDVSLLMDKAEQSMSYFSPRDTPRTSVKPSTNALLYPRFRLYRPVSMSRPIAKIVSAVKATASTTATITTDIAHGLVTGNYVTIKGIRDYATNFPALATPTVVTVINATSFTIPFGAAAIATSYGGSVIISNGGKDQPGYIASTVQSVVSRIANGNNWLDVVGSVTWAGLVNPGDYINLHGLRSAVNGSDLGLDGVWEVAHIATTIMTVRPVFDFAGTRMSPALGTLTSTNCGGTALLRQTLRAHDLAVTSWRESVVSIDGAGTNRLDKAIPIVHASTLSISGNVNTTETALLASSVSAITTVASAPVGVVLKSTAGSLYQVTASNTTGTLFHIKLYNKSTAPVVGTDIPIITIPVPANTCVPIDFGRLGARFTAGIGYSITGAIASTDTTAVLAGSLVTIQYV